MAQSVEQLAAVIAAHLSEWGGTPYVELAVFGTDDPLAIARAIDDLCRRELGSGVAEGLWHQSSIGAVSGVRLGDGRRVVIKGHQPERRIEWLREVVRVQAHLASHGRYATTVHAGPAPLGRGLAVVEAMVDGGETKDAHVPAIRRALARALHDVVATCRPLVAGSTLTAQLLTDPPQGTLWPTPHSKLFDFAATAAGAEWIDAVAREARSRMAPAGEVVIGHGDWRAEHVLFVGEQPVAAFDWDSLCKEREPALVGYTAHAFCADWTKNERIPPAPTLEEARAFVRDYEESRGSAFDGDERRLCAAAFAYSCAYTARCGWALGADERRKGGSFQHLVHTEGVRLLGL
jgi:hypothetical protein